ncbi:MAG: amidohydrolase [Acidobacteriia bacterium]|nr:amidohydrolase [Terriglobia bacterium]
MKSSTLFKKNKNKLKTQNQKIIDCDIHNFIPSNETLYKYLPQRWREHHQMFGLRGHLGSFYPRALMNAARHDSWPPSGLPAGSDLDFMKYQLLDLYDIEFGVLNCLFGVGGQLNLEYGAALARAINDWQIAEWLDPEPRLRASLVIPYEDAELAAEEIDRVGSHPGFVQVLFLVRTREPLGRRKYHGIYEAAIKHNLPVGIHFGGAGGGPLTGAGWPSYYIEDHGGMPQAFQSQVISLVFEGIFEKFPLLKVVLIEGGFGWMPSLMWRLDNCWKKLPQEVPALKSTPSSYIRKHIWMSTQPMEEPSKPVYFKQLLEHLDASDRLLFATDYPHWDFDSPEAALPAGLDDEVRKKIMSENARTLYDLN